MGAIGQDVQALFRAAVRRHQSGDIDEAAEVYEQILRESPEHSGALHLLGVVYLARHDLQKARSYIERALSLCHTKAVYWNNYGAVLKGLKRLVEAKAAFEKALAIRPDYPDAWSNLGLAQLELGKIDQAEQSLRQALRLQPRHADALRHLARLCRDKGQLEEAVGLCRDCLAVGPSRVETYALLGETLCALKRFDEAAEAYRQALTVKPDSAEAHVSLGLVHTDLDQVDKARRAFAVAASLRPDRPMWRFRHLGLCPVVFPSVEAVMEYRAELERQLDEALAERPPFDWRRAFYDGFTPSFNLYHHGLCDRALREKFARLFAPAFPRERPEPQRGGKIRVGFLATYGHQGGFLRGFAGLMERLDRSRFEVVGLVSAGIVKACRRQVRSPDVDWVGFPHNIERAQEAIRRSRCDNIMHWQAGTDIVDYFLPFLPLAPVQCIGFGQHGTTGIGNIDYFVSSRLFERGPQAQEDYTERLIQFEGATAWHPRPACPPPAKRADFGLPDSGALYFCPQRPAKFHPDFDRLLRGILDADPTGHIVVLRGERTMAVESLRARFGCTLGERLKQRVLFLPSLAAEDYNRLVSIADVMLDAPSYSASYTGYDAFALGVPLVTLPGKYMVQRYALGLYTRMGISELVASDEQHYIEVAVRLGRDTEYRDAVKRKILDRSELLYEDPQVVSRYEAFFEKAIQQIGCTDSETRKTRPACHGAQR